MQCSDKKLNDAGHYLEAVFRRIYPQDSSFRDKACGTLNN